MGDATQPPQRFKNLEKVFVRYIADQLRAGNSFYISDQLNSEALKGVNPDDLLTMFPGSMDVQGMGFLAFLAPIFAAVVGGASAAGSAILAAAPSIASLTGSIAAIKTISAANQHAAASGVQVPTSIANPALNAVKQDVLAGTGLTTNVLMLVAGGGLLLYALTGRRR